MPHLSSDGPIHVLDLGSGQNRINPDWIADVNAALDDVTESEPPRGLVTTASGEFFSMGLDLDWMAANPGGAPEQVAQMHELFARMLALPVPTVAAIGGHAVAGGALFALAHDHRVMRADHGIFSLPEIDVQIAITPGLVDMIKARLAPQVAFELLTGRPYKGPRAIEAGIVQRLAASDDEVRPAAVALIEKLSEKDPDTYGTVKSRIYADVIEALRDRDANAADVTKFEPAMAALGIARP